MKSWDVTALDAEPRMPKILSSSGDARVVVLALPDGERLQEHEVHERAWIFVVAGQIDVSADGAGRVLGDVGALFEFAPQERREVVARSDARLLLLLAPWPGDGHPGVMTLEQKARARENAAEHAEQTRSRNGG
jgi:redox-sensitive bicupin YhaK (pirin superfamily)